MSEPSFIKLCEYGKLDEAKQLFEANPTINISYNNEQAFRLSCHNGHLEVAQWLLQIPKKTGRPDIDISIHDEEAFRFACYDGHLLVAQWLHQIHKETGRPDINISFNVWFNYAGYYGHLEVCQWLLQIKPDLDISADNDLAFRNACETRHLLVAQWLQSLKPYLYVIHYNDDDSYKGYYIRSKEEERWETIKLLVWLASDQSPNKKCLLYRIPQDVSRYIISNYL